MPRMRTDASVDESPGLRARLSAELGRRPGLRRELWFAGGALFVGLIAVPLLIYVVGVLTLGPYASGGLGAFLADFFLGLVRGWPAAWAIVLGPYAGILLLRTTRLVLRRYLSSHEWT